MNAITIIIKPEARSAGNPQLATRPSLLVARAPPHLLREPLPFMI